MFCPNCRDEFRAGFTRCGTCGVDLVEDLSGRTAAGSVARPAERSAGAGRAAPPAGAAPAARADMAEYCGFLTLEDARDARAKLRPLGIASALVVRDSADAPDGEEYWLHVDRRRWADVERVLGYHAVEEDEPVPGFQCEACGSSVPEDASSCPGCGAKFEDGA